jgi:hypothetical protein
LFIFIERAILLNKPPFSPNPLSSEDLIDTCLRHLEQLPGIQAWVNLVPEASNFDAMLEIVAEQSLQHETYICQIKTRILKNSLGVVITHLAQWQKEHQSRLLLISDYLSDSVIDGLLHNGIEYIDAVGNMYLNSPAAYILIRGQRPLKTQKNSKSVLTVSNLKLIYAILCRPSVLEMGYRDVAEIAGVSLGTVSEAIQELLQTNYISRSRAGGFQIANYKKLLNVWELGYAEKLRSKLWIGTYAPIKNQRFDELSDEIMAHADSNQYWVGGELGAAIATQYLRPQQATLHVTENYRDILLKLRLKPSPQGQITLLRQFGTANGWQSEEGAKALVNPLLIRVELLMQNDERLLATAELLSHHYLRNLPLT